MVYKEKWLSLKEEIETVVNHGLQSVGQMSIENQNRFIAYRNVLDSMYELDSKEKTKQKSNKETVYETVDEKLDKILDDLLYEMLVDLSKKQTLKTD